MNITYVRFEYIAHMHRGQKVNVNGRQGAQSRTFFI